MECKRKKFRRKSDNITLSIIHDIKKIAPLMKDQKKNQDKIIHILDGIINKEMDILEENKVE